MSKVRIQMKQIKNVLSMHLVDDYSMRKIADRTGIPYSTVNDNITLAKCLVPHSYTIAGVRYERRSLES